MWFLAGYGESTAQLPADFQEETVLSGLNNPTAMEFLPDGRMLTILKGGTILITDNPQPQTPPVSTSTYMTIPDINTGGERGSTNMILDPDFLVDSFFYVYYPHNSEGLARLSRFRFIDDPGASNADKLATELVIWKDNIGFVSCCHYGGGMGFFPDGSMYLLTGDKFEAFRAQDTTDSSGKLHRFYRDGSIPDDNPFKGRADVPETIFGIGIRNPFTAFETTYNDKVFFGEVGGNKQSAAWEDIHTFQLSDNDTLAPGVDINFGWPDCGDGGGGVTGGTNPNGRETDGSCTNSEFLDPYYTYPHNGSGASVMMGFVYTGNQFPPDPYQNAVFIGDQTDDWIKYLTNDGGTITENQFKPGGANRVVHLEQGPDGSLYWVGFTGNVNRIFFTGNLAPVIDSFVADPISNDTAPFIVNFNFGVSDMDDPPGELTYTLTFGDGSQTTGTLDTVTLPISHTYTSNGVYEAFLQVADSLFIITSQTITIQVGTPPVVTITAPLDSSFFRAADTISISGTANDPDGSIDTVYWEAEINNFGTFQPRAEGGGTSGNFVVPMDNHVSFSGGKYYRITITAVDNDGLTASASINVLPEMSDLTFISNPSGITVRIDGKPNVTPYTYNELVGFKHIYEVPDTLCLGGMQYAFSSWSDSGSRIHTIPTPEMDSTFAITYSQTGGSCGPPDPNFCLVFNVEADSDVRTNGAGVTSWVDQVDDTDSLVTLGGSPNYLQNIAGLRGHNALQFDGSGDYMGFLSGIGSLPIGNSERSVFIVVKYSSGGFGGFVYGSTGSNKAFGPMVTGSGCAAQAQAGELANEGWGCSNNVYTGEQVIDSGWLVQAVVFDNGFTTIYKDGIDVGSKSTSYATGAEKVRLARQLSDGSYIDMCVAEIIVYNCALDQQGIQDVQDYLYEKYFSPPNVGFTLTETNNTTLVTESGSKDTVFVVLDTQPASNVVILVSSGDTGEATVSPATLTFTSGNWDMPQEFVVMGVDDDLIDGNQTSTITISIDDANSDDNFDALADKMVSTTTTDDDVAGFTISETGGTSEVAEAGSKDTITAVLDAQPGSDVVITVSSDDTGEATVSPAILTFTSGNWDTPQEVIVMGIDDDLIDGNQTSTITFSIDTTNSDDNFDSLLDQAVWVITKDNDSIVFACDTNLVLDSIIPSDDYGAIDSITITGQGQVDSGSVVTFKAPEITLKPNAHLQFGSEGHLVADSCLPVIISLPLLNEPGSSDREFDRQPWIEPEHLSASNYTLKLYPNPTDGRLYFMIEDGIEPGEEIEIRIFNPVGELVFYNKDHYSGHHVLNLLDLPPGIYTFKIIAGRKKGVERFIKL